MHWKLGVSGTYQAKGRTSIFHSSDIIAHCTIWFSGTWYFHCRAPVISWCTWGCAQTGRWGDWAQYQGCDCAGKRLVWGTMCGWRQPLPDPNTSARERPGQKPSVPLGGEVNRKDDVTAREGQAAVPWPERHHQESGFLYFWALLQRNIHPNGSDRGGHTCVSCGGGCWRPPDSPTWLRALPRSLQCLLHVRARLGISWIWLQQRQLTPWRSPVADGSKSWFSLLEDMVDKGGWPLGHVKKAWRSLGREESQPVDDLNGGAGSPYKHRLKRNSIKMFMIWWDYRWFCFFLCTF